MSDWKVNGQVFWCRNLFDIYGEKTSESESRYVAELSLKLFGLNLQLSFHHTNEPHREKTGFWLCENKGADMLCSNCEADQRLCFRYMDSTNSLLKTEIASF